MSSSYDTTSDMIIQTIEDNGITKLLAIDRKGLYLTTQDRVDRKLADVNRYGIPREAIYERLIELGMDPHQLFNDNRHLIKSDTDTRSGGKILNPIKASKRKLKG